MALCEPPEIADIVGPMEACGCQSAPEQLPVARMSDAEARDAATKDVIWPSPDWTVLIAAGLEIRAAALIKIVRDRIPLRPPYGIRQNGTHYASVEERTDALVRGDYSRMVGIVRDAFMAAKDVSGVRGARTKVMALIGWSATASHATRHLLTSVWRGPIDTLLVDYRDLAKAESMTISGWPDVGASAWRRGHVVRADGEGGYLLARGIRIVADGFNSEEQAWGWLRGATGGVLQDRLPMPERPIQSGIRRKGLAARRNGDVSTSELMARFGIRAIEFDGWVPQHERQGLLNAVHDSFADLAEALGIPEAGMSLGGTLALSIGARASGAGAADYDAQARALVLPRSSGAGEMARCWAMAFDMWSGETGMVEKPFAQRGASGRSPGVPAIAVPETAHLSDGEAKAWARLTAAIWRSEPRSFLAIVEAERELSARVAELSEAEVQRTAFAVRMADSTPTAEGAAYLRDIEGWLEQRRQRTIPDLTRQLAGYRARDVDAGASSYAQEARKLCGRDGDKWGRPQEMFARAIECLVSDRLLEMGGQNPFLVHGVEEGRFSTGWRGDPYPGGHERRRITDAAQATMAAMCHRLSPAMDASRHPEGSGFAL